MHFLRAVTRGQALRHVSLALGKRFLPSAWTTPTFLRLQSFVSKLPVLAAFGKAYLT